jgi:hypothetical protein
LAKFIPSTSQQEETMGYNKFELGAVMIQDGFQVYEILKATRNIILQLQATLFQDMALSRDSMSIMEFYLRQISSFCDVMADLGLFGVMDSVVEMYAIMPRGSVSVKRVATKPIPVAPLKVAVAPPAAAKPPKKKKVVEETPPKKKQSGARAIFDNGYSDPFGNASSQSPKEVKETKGGDPDDGEGEAGEDGDDSQQEIIYFDVKTGTIGRISRSKCREKSIIVTQDEEGQELLDGGVDDEEEKEQLIWLLKKGMKQKQNGPTTAATTAASNNSKNSVAMPPKSPLRKKAKPPKQTSPSSKSPPTGTKNKPTVTKPPSVTPSKKSPPTGTKNKPTVTKPLAVSPPAAHPAKKYTTTYEQRLQKEMKRCQPLKLSELKMELKSNHVSTLGFCEKSEFVHAVRL